LKPEITGAIRDEPSVKTEPLSCAGFFGASAGLIGPHTVQISPSGFVVTVVADVVAE
jgi:hypothetical protein